MEGRPTIDWHDFIEVKTDVMAGKPVFKGTRITVEIVLEWLATGWQEQEILDNYPRLTKDSLRAVYALARDTVHQQPFIASQAA